MGTPGEPRMPHKDAEVSFIFTFHTLSQCKEETMHEVPWEGSFQSLEGLEHSFCENETKKQFYLFYNHFCPMHENRMVFL